LSSRRWRFDLGSHGQGLLVCVTGSHGAYPTCSPFILISWHAAIFCVTVDMYV
jgi:hypothetical protein